MITLEESLKLNPKLNPELFIPNPVDVPRKMKESPIKDWLRFVAEEYIVPENSTVIFIPCSFFKPYTPPHDEFYERIHQLKKRVNNSIHFITVSVPLVLEPEEFWSFQWNGLNLIYDCPFFPWIRKFGYEYNEKIEEEVFSVMKDVMQKSIERNRERIRKIISFFIKSSNPIEYRLVKSYSDVIIPSFDLKKDVSYFNNTSEVYCDERVWNEFIKKLKEEKVII